MPMIMRPKTNGIVSRSFVIQPIVFTAIEQNWSNQQRISAAYKNLKRHISVDSIAFYNEIWHISQIETNQTFKSSEIPEEKWSIWFQFFLNFSKLLNGCSAVICKIAWSARRSKVQAETSIFLIIALNLVYLLRYYFAQFSLKFLMLIFYNRLICSGTQSVIINCCLPI